MIAGSVCVIGSINMDLVVRTPRLPAAGETVLGGPFQTFPGGKGANQAVAAARMGAVTTMVGCVGDDPYGWQMRHTLANEDIDVSCISDHEDAATGVALITVDDRTGENTIVVAGEANLTLTPDRVSLARSAIDAADVLLMQLEIPTDVVARAASLAREFDTIVILNAAPAAALPASLLSQLDCLIVNRGEAALLAGRSSDDEPGALASALAATGPSTVIITLGSHGAYLHTPDDASLLPAFAVEAVDAVGAGDAFAGAFAAAIARGEAVRNACTIASAAGALAATHRGAIPSLPTAEEVATFLAASDRIST
ncbi:MAG: ribokinase [Phycisphaerales bacterium]|nr:MAG: ribokinase [Phycisphaerales bacterium]